MVTKIVYYLNKKTNSFEKITIKGHAEYANKGQDVVCAAISAITNGTINFLQKNYPHYGQISYLSAEIIISLQVSNPEYQLCLKLMIYQLENIANSYPNYLKINPA